MARSEPLKLVFGRSSAEFRGVDVSTRGVGQPVASGRGSSEGPLDASSSGLPDESLDPDLGGPRQGHPARGAADRREDDLRPGLGGTDEDRPRVDSGGLSGDQVVCYLYRLAGYTVASDLEMDQLAAFALPGSTPNFRAPGVSPAPGATAAADLKAGGAAALATWCPSPPSADIAVRRQVPAHAGAASGRLLHRGQGWVANAWRQVDCWLVDEGYQLVLDGVGTYLVRCRGEEARLLSRAPEAGMPAVVEAMLGPALILALALRGTWCLHASAVELDGRAIVFVSESGGGKSTLAAYLASQAEGPFRHLADDILPVAWSANSLYALPRFPQLKLAADAQPGAAARERLPLAACYRLVAPDAGAGKRIPGPAGLATPGRSGSAADIRPLSAGDAALALVRHSVAARLFGEQLLADQLSFCARAAEQVPVRELAYARTWEALPGVAASLLADLGQAPQPGART